MIVHHLPFKRIFPRTSETERVQSEKRMVSNKNTVSARGKLNPKSPEFVKTEHQNMYSNLTLVGES